MKDKIDSNDREGKEGKDILTRMDVRLSRLEKEMEKSLKIKESRKKFIEQVKDREIQERTDKAINRAEDRREDNREDEIIETGKNKNDKPERRS